MSALSEPLRRAVSLPEADAIEAIASSAALADELRNALPQLHAAAIVPAGEYGVKTVVARRFPLYPQPDRNEGEVAEWWADYIEVCGDLPTAVLEAGMKAWVKRADAAFMPKPGELRAAAVASQFEEGRILTLARKALDARREREALATRQEFTLEAPELKRIFKPPEDRELVRQQQAEFLAAAAQRQAAKPPPAGDFHLSQGKPVAGGLTALMRRHMGLDAEPEAEPFVPAYAQREAEQRAELAAFEAEQEAAARIDASEVALDEGFVP